MVLFGVMSIVAYLKAYVIFLSGIFNNFKVMLMLGAAFQVVDGVFLKLICQDLGLYVVIFTSPLLTNTVGLYQSMLYSRLILDHVQGRQLILNS